MIGVIKKFLVWWQESPTVFKPREEVPETVEVTMASKCQEFNFKHVTLVESVEVYSCESK